MKKWSSDRWLSLVAIIASMGTLFTVVYQTNLIRKQQYASVLPYLEMWNSSNQDSYRLVLANNGIGPAFVEDVKIHFEDSTYQMDPAIFLREVISKEDTINRVRHSNISRGRLIPAGKQINLIEVENDSVNAGKLWYWFSANNGALKDGPEVEIVYRSIYEERWQAFKNSGAEPIKLN
ncbi:MAG: hypothetical protein AB8B73_08270 [Ekhidna sp.]